MSRTLKKYLIIVADDFGYSAERDDGIVQCFKRGGISCVSVMMNGHSVRSAVKKADEVGMPMGGHDLTETLKKYLIIVADDFGYSAERDDGIVQCFKRGGISCVSVMVNRHSVRSAVKKAEEVGMPMHLHLNLTEGRPVSTNGCNSLTDEDGFMLGKMGFREAVEKGKVDMVEVKQEIQAQIDTFHKLTGKQPVEVDGHQHIHVVPGICEVFAEVLEANGVKMSRLPIEEDISSHTWLSQNQQDFMECVVRQSKMAQEIFSKHGIWAPGFVGLKTMGKDMVTTHLQANITAAFTRLYKSSNDGKDMAATSTSSGACTNISHSMVTNSVFRSEDKGQFKAGQILPVADSIVCELMVHPGNITGNSGGCGNGPDGFSQSLEREHEMAVLMSEEMLTFYKHSDISLVAFHYCMEKVN